MTTPADFTAYWDAIDAELAGIEPAPALTETPLRSTEFSTAYDLKLTSIGPYRIFGFLSVPKGEGPFPAVLHSPRYGSVNNPPHWDDRQRYVVLTIMHRGQRLADTPYKAEYPGLLTVGIESPETWIYRSILADIMRGAEYLLAHPKVDPSRVAIAGDDLGLIAAARRPGFSTLNLTMFHLYRILEARHANRRLSGRGAQRIPDDVSRSGRCGREHAELFRSGRACAGFHRRRRF